MNKNLKILSVVGSFSVLMILFQNFAKNEEVQVVSCPVAEMQKDYRDEPRSANNNQSKPCSTYKIGKVIAGFSGKSGGVTLYSIDNQPVCVFDSEVVEKSKLLQHLKDKTVRSVSCTTGVINNSLSIEFIL